MLQAGILSAERHTSLPPSEAIGEGTIHRSTEGAVQAEGLRFPGRSAHDSLDRRRFCWTSARSWFLMAVLTTTILFCEYHFPRPF